jgi:hypothetical protein
MRFVPIRFGCSPTDAPLLQMIGKQSVVERTNKAAVGGHLFLQVGRRLAQRRFASFVTKPLCCRAAVAVMAT